MANTWITAPVATFSGASVNNGGGYSANYDYATFGFDGLHDTVNEDGSPVIEATGCNIEQGASDGGGGYYVRITKAGAFLTAGEDSLVGLWAAVTDDSGTYSADRYEVKGMDNTDGDWVDVGLTYTGDVTSSNVSIYIGGFFASPQSSATESEAGDTVNWMKGTYTLSANLTLTAGSAGSPITYQSIDTDGVVVNADRATQSGKSTGWLDTTDMAIINGNGSGYLIPGSFNVLSNFKITNSGTHVINNTDADEVSGYKIVMENSAATGNTYNCFLDNACSFNGCDIINKSTNHSSYCVRGDYSNVFVGCRCSMASSSGTLFWANGSGWNLTELVIFGCGIAFEIYGSIATVGQVNNNTFYDVGTCVKSRVAGPLQVANNLAVNCTNFCYNNVASDIGINSANNVLVNVANDYTGNTNVFYGILGINDVYDADSNTATNTFVSLTAGSEDFNLKSGSDAIGAAMFGNDCGAIQTLGTSSGGGGISLSRIVGGI